MWSKTWLQYLTAFSCVTKCVHSRPFVFNCVCVCACILMWDSVCHRCNMMTLIALVDSSQVRKSMQKYELLMHLGPKIGEWDRERTRCVEQGKEVESESDQKAREERTEWAMTWEWGGKQLEREKRQEIEKERTMEWSGPFSLRKLPSIKCSASKWGLTGLRCCKLHYLQLQLCQNGHRDGFKGLIQGFILSHQIIAEQDQVFMGKVLLV